RRKLRRPSRPERASATGAEAAVGLRVRRDPLDGALRVRQAGQALGDEPPVGLRAVRNEARAGIAGAWLVDVEDLHLWGAREVEGGEIDPFPRRASPGAPGDAAPRRLVDDVPAAVVALRDVLEDAEGGAHRVSRRRARQRRGAGEASEGARPAGDGALTL